MGMHDVPTFIDHIIDTTGQEKITYIGHSQGTTQLFLAASLNPSYFNSKINLFTALGPVTSLNNMKVPLMRATAKNWPETEYLALKFGAYNLMNANWAEETAMQLFCNAIPGVCDFLVSYVADSNTDVDNMDRWNVVLKDFPAGNGWGNLVFYA
jgi:pimeloyl-ACP methyl ester carboxylesterase